MNLEAFPAALSRHHSSLALGLDDAIIIDSRIIYKIFSLASKSWTFLKLLLYRRSLFLSLFWSLIKWTSGWEMTLQIAALSRTFGLLRGCVSKMKLSCNLIVISWTISKHANIFLANEACLTLSVVVGVNYTLFNFILLFVTQFLEGWPSKKCGEKSFEEGGELKKKL